MLAVITDKLVRLGFILWFASMPVMLGPGPGRADVYKYVDADGIVHFTDAPGHDDFQLIYRDSRPKELDRPKQEEKGEQPEAKKPITLADLVGQIADNYRLDPNLVLAVIETESDFNPNAVSPKGALGLMQLMPNTAAQLNVTRPFDIKENLEGGVKHLAELLDFYKGNLPLALAAYNAGKEAVSKYRSIPPFKETQRYVRKVLQRFRRYQRANRAQ
jgi:hypothetical protein